MLIIEKEEKRNNGRNTTTKSRNHRNTGRKRKLQVLGSVGSGHHRQTEMKVKVKRVPQKNKKTPRSKTLQQKSHQRNKHLDSNQTKEELRKFDQRTRKLLAMLKARKMIKIDFVCQEKKEKDYPALGIALKQQFEDSRNTEKMQRKTNCNS